MAWEAVKDVNAAEFDNGGMWNKEGRAVCENLERIVTVQQWGPSAKRLYLAVREEYLSTNMTRRSEAV